MSGECVSIIELIDSAIEKHGFNKKLILEGINSASLYKVNPNGYEDVSTRDELLSRVMEELSLGKLKIENKELFIHSKEKI